PEKDERLKGKEDWIVKEQVKADSKEQAETIAQKNGGGRFEPSDKTRLRQALDASEKEFFITHFNAGATSAGPCLGSGAVSVPAGKWLNDSIRENCFGISVSGDRKNIYNPNAFTADQIDAYIKKTQPRSPLNGKGVAFVNAGLKYGVNPGFLLGMANAESSLGMQCLSGTLLVGTNNAFGLTDGSGQTSFRRFSSYEDGILAAASNASSSGYKSLNGTVAEFGLRWCGYETESSGPGVKLSNGTVINYDCKNGKSNWAQEVGSVIDAMIAASPNAGQQRESNSQKPENCPQNPPKAGPSDDRDYQAQVAKEFEAEMSRQNPTMSTDTEGNITDWSGQNLPEGVLNVPGIDESSNGLTHHCNRAAAGMVYLYRTGKQVWSTIGSWLNGLGSTVSILARVGTSVVDKSICASSDNWAEIRHQVIDKKNPVVLATDFGSHRMHYITIVGFVGNRVYFNDDSHFVANGGRGQVVARWIDVNDLNQHLHHSTNGCRFLYATK
ncbi:hypothetical protein COT77_01510, partial [Candidatus Berkelbacteria bacterium CG10_big_fil_rev_8_21_14_0_10_41_12]